MTRPAAPLARPAEYAVYFAWFVPFLLALLLALAVVWMLVAVDFVVCASRGGRREGRTRA